jgi:hypothetical protein
MIGKLSNAVPDCKLNRIDRRTYVTMSPPIIDIGGDDYYTYSRHDIKIMRISMNNVDDLFTAPMLPGDHYNISLAMYDESEVLVEKTGINMTDVLGKFLDVAFLTVDPGLDPYTPSIFEFNFKLGD